MAVAKKSRLRKTARAFLYAPVVKSFILKIPVVRKIYPYPSVERTHPIDIHYGIDTSGHIDKGDQSNPDENLLPLISDYVASQPSIIRTGLKALGHVEDYTFIDLGCGKGRVAIVASEFPFRDVIGVELFSALAEIGRVNAGKIMRRFPDRPRITIAEANVVDFELPPGKLVFFNFNAFGAEIVGQMVKKFEAALDAGTPHIFFVYYNPKHVEALDASPAFTRYYARKIPYDKSELGFGPKEDDVVVIWQSVRGSIPTPHKLDDL